MKIEYILKTYEEKPEIELPTQQPSLEDWRKEK